MKRLLALCFTFLITTLLISSCYLDPEKQCEDDKGCLGGQVCGAGGKCACPGNLSVCFEGTPQLTCVDKNTDANNCGQCGKKCAPGEQCKEGSCKGCDSAASTICGGGCVDVNTSIKHCGRCGNECKGGEECNKGKCGCPTNKPDTCNDVCVDTKADTKNCGACGTECKGNEACSDGKCIDCPKERTCGTECPDLKTSEKHCGKCDNACKSGEECCDGGCIDLQTNTENCGKCGNKCPTGSSCKAGKCECDDAGKKNCLTVCADLSTDSENCGACGNACPSGSKCDKGECCKDGSEQNCNGACINTQTDENNCGGCNKSCNGLLCKAGKCEKCLTDADCGSGLSCDKGTGACICGAKCGWVTTLGTASADVELRAIAIDKDRNTYVTGFAKGELKVNLGKNTITLKALGGQDIIVAKVNSRGELAWVKRYGGPGEDNGYGITVDTNNNILVTGSFGGKDVAFGSTKLSSVKKGSNHTTDVFVLGLDTSGKELWALSGGDEGTDIGRAIVADKNGAYITGRFGGLAKFGTKILPPTTTTSSSKSEVFVVKVDTQKSPPVFAWALTPLVNSNKNHGEAVGYGIAVGSNGSLFVTGSCNDVIKTKAGDICTNAPSMFILEATTETGQKEFAKGLSAQAAGAANAIAMDGSNVPFVTGGSPSAKFGSQTFNPTGNRDLYIALTEIPLDFDSIINAGAQGSTAEGTGIKWFNDEKYVTGWFTKDINLGSNNFNSQGESDVFVAVVDKANKWKWSLSMGGKKSDRAYGIIYDQLGGAYVVGYYEDTASNVAIGQSKPATIKAKGNRDGFVWKVAP